MPNPNWSLTVNDTTYPLSFQQAAAVIEGLRELTQTPGNSRAEIKFRPSDSDNHVTVTFGAETPFKLEHHSEF